MSDVLSVSLFHNEDGKVSKGIDTSPFALTLSGYPAALITSSHYPFIYIMTISFSPPISGTVLGSETIRKERGQNRWLPAFMELTAESNVDACALSLQAAQCSDSATGCWQTK